jgi:outer membrane protein OmpA-like peptidoglycan-associated protein
MKVNPFILLGLLLLIGCSANKGALIEANDHFEIFEYDLAINSYKKSFDQNPSQEAAYKLAISYLKKREFRDAEYWYTIYRQKGEMDVSKLYELTEIYIGNSKFEDAKSALTSIATLDSTQTEIGKWNMLNKSASEAKDLLNVDTDYVLMPLKSVNTAFSEFGYTQFDGRKYFVSDRISAGSGSAKNSSASRMYGWTGNGYLQVFEADFDSLSMDLKNITASNEFKGELHMGPVTLDSSLAFNTYTPKDEKARVGKLDEVIPKINFSDRLTGKRQLINSLVENFLTDPFWDTKAQRLYFAADFSGGFGELDLYYMDLVSGELGVPINLGSGINSFGIERSPFIHQDTLYFSSDGLGGLGGLDIYSSPIQQEQSSKPVNLGVPFNSNKDDFFFYIDDSLQGIKFLSSDRDGSVGMDDIYYVFQIPEDLIRRIVVIVTDEDTGVPLENMVVEFQRPATKLIQNLITSELGLADFNLDLSDSLIRIKVYGSGYLNYEIEAHDVQASDTVFVALQKLRLNTPVVLEDIKYDFDKYTIRPSENESLIKLINNLRFNPDLNVELRSHTDTRGTPGYNQQLSEQRSASVLDFLIRRGVQKSRIFLQSYGESYPLVKCGDQCPEAKHALNRRTEFVFFYGEFQDSPYTYPVSELDKGRSIQSDIASQNSPKLFDSKVNRSVAINTTNTSNQNRASDYDSTATANDFGFYYLVVGSFQTLAEAQKKVVELKSKGFYTNQIIAPMDAKSRYRVAIEEFLTYDEASEKIDYYKEKMNRKDVWILYVDKVD